MAQDKDIGHLNLNLGPDEEFPVPAAAGEDTRPMAAVMEQAQEDLHLAADHGLVAVKAYIKDESRARQRTASAERQERFLEKKKAEGLTKTFVPAPVAEAVKAAGSFDTWLQAERVKAVEAAVAATPTTSVPPPAEVVEKIVKVPAELSKDDAEALALGRRVQGLAGWRATVLSWLI